MVRHCKVYMVVWYGIAQHGTEWYSMVWYGILCGLVHFSFGQELSAYTLLRGACTPGLTHLDS